MPADRERVNVTEVCAGAGAPVTRVALEVSVSEEEGNDQEPAKDPRANSALPNKLSKESDRAVRPGFRNPPNQRSKAQKKKR